MMLESKNISCKFQGNCGEKNKLKAAVPVYISQLHFSILSKKETNFLRPLYTEHCTFFLRQLFILHPLANGLYIPRRFM